MVLLTLLRFQSSIELMAHKGKPYEHPNEGVKGHDILNVDE